jgi:hypothetical protein
MPLSTLARRSPPAPVSAPAPAGPTQTSVAASLQAAAAAAAAAASAAAGTVYSAAAPYAAPLANNISSFTLSMTASLPVRSMASQLQSAASAGHSTAVATVATVAAALESSWSRDRWAPGRGHVCLLFRGARGQDGKRCLCSVLHGAVNWNRRPPNPQPPPSPPLSSPLIPSPPTHALTRRAPGVVDPGLDCPSAWFVADDPASHTRFIVIQGSDNLDHWRVNLTFDPVAFEDLGVKVHRGVYETALQVCVWGGVDKKKWAWRGNCCGCLLLSAVW